METDPMLREMDRRRSALRAGLAATCIWLPFVLATALPSRAQDATSNAQSRDVAKSAGHAGDIAISSAARTSLRIDVPLPPYPPPIFGLAVPARHESLRYSSAHSFARAPSLEMTSGAQSVSVTHVLPDTLTSKRDGGAIGSTPDASRAPLPPTPDAPAPSLARAPSAPVAPSATAPVEPQAASPSTAATVSAPSATPVAGDVQSAGTAQAAFAKAEQSALFPRLGKNERMAITAYYEKRGFEPIWIVNGAPTRAAIGLIDRLAHAGEDGLDPDEYAAAGASAVSSAAEDLAEAEWRISAAVLAYARDARGARVVPTRLSGLITPALSLPDAETVLDTLTHAPDASAALQNFNPHADGYLNLRIALAKLRAQMIAPSPVKSESVRGAQLASVAPETLKERSGGAVDQAARRAVSTVSSKRAEADILANMERWRWLPPDLGDRYILVNVPEFTLRYVNSGVLSHLARVIVGKPSSPTPLFSGDMKFVVVNPSWYIPPSILRKEFLPKLVDDPLYAERQGYVVVRHGDRISIRQPPGERNALGRIKFMFPNEHSVYLHDTPTRSLFAKTDRALSHGCVRVDEPFKLAEYVLNDEATWPERRIERMVGKGERTINLAQQLPVHLAYFTLSADANGRLHRFGDLYGLDSRLEAMLSSRK
jgi:murein L,D-transpeptidase YcbB/YkuD